MDLGDWLRGERDWRDLFDLLDEMPYGSRYSAAMLMDREIAEQIVDAEEEAAEAAGDVAPERREYRPPLAGYSPLMQKLDDVLDVLITSQATQAHADPRNAGKVPRPQTAAQILRDERDSARLNSFVDQLFGGN